MQPNSQITRLKKENYFAKPLSQEEYISHIIEGIQDADNGRVTEVSVLQAEMKQWSNTESHN